MCALSAQQPTFRARTDLVQIDVVVTDRDGNAVTGLTKDDFLVYDRRTLQTIDLFDEFSYNAKAAAARPDVFPPTLNKDFASNSSAQAQRLIMIVIDDLHLFKNRTERAKEIAKKIVVDLGAESSMAVLFTSGEGSIEITQNQGELLKAIDRLKGRRPYPRPLTAESQRGGDLQAFNDNMSAVRTVKDAARALIGGQQRRKAFVWISEGFAREVIGIFGATAPPSNPLAGAEGYASGDLEAMAKGAPEPDHTTQELIDMMDTLRRANVAAYSIDPRGEITPQGLASECHPSKGFVDDPCLGGAAGGPTAWTSWVRISQRQVQLTAEASGGFAVVNSNDFTGGIDRIVRDLDQYYVLGFQPSDTKGDGYRAIQVSVKNRPDLTLRYRRGYVGNVKAPEPKNTDPLAELAAGALPVTDLPLRLGAMPRPFVTGDGTSVVSRGERPKDPKAAKVSIALEVTVPRAQVARSDGTLSDSFKFTVFAVNMKSKKVDAQFTNTALLTSDRMPKEAVGEDIAFLIPVEMTLSPGAYQLRASATSTRLDKGGSVFLSIDVPDFSSAPIAISGLIVGQYGAPRVPVAETPVRLPFAPSVDREFFSTDTLRVYFEVANRRANASIPTTIEVIAHDGKVMKSATPRMEPVDLGKLDVQVPLAGLPAGAYVLRVSATDQGKTAARETGFIVK